MISLAAFEVMFSSSPIAGSQQKAVSGFPERFNFMNTIFHSYSYIIQDYIDVICRWAKCLLMYSLDLVVLEYKPLLALANSSKFLFLD